MKRHIGKVFEFAIEDYSFFGLCTYYDDTFGYHLIFSSRVDAVLNLVSGNCAKEDQTLNAFVSLDAILRAKEGKRIETLSEFKPFLPVMRGGGGARPDGSLKSWWTYDKNGWNPSDEDDPGLPDMSECAILGIGSVKDILQSKVSRREAFEILRQTSSSNIE